MVRQKRKRQADFEILSNWIERDSRVLDIGCGKGIFLEYLQHTKNVYGVGVDVDPDRIQSCVKRGVSAYQGDAQELISIYDEKYFDWVIISRTMPELSQPEKILNQALRVGKNVAVGFPNHAFWKNRISTLLTGTRMQNDVFPKAWQESRPDIAITIKGFESYCESAGIEISQKAYLSGDWKSKCSFRPNLMSGYAVFSLHRD